MKDAKYNRIYVIQWDDAETQDDWQTIDQVIEAARLVELVQTVGHLVYKTTDHIVLCATMQSQPRGNVCQTIRIPRANIHSMKCVRIGGEVKV